MGKKQGDTVKVVRGKSSTELERGENDDPALVRLVHGSVFGGAVYSGQIREAFNLEQLTDTAYLHVDAVVKSMKPRDALEEMLIVQALWTHARLAQLHQRATVRQTLDGSRTLHEAIDRAANTFRRQMLALNEYRNPRQGDSITLVKAGQANLAHQQIVNPGLGSEKGTNEQGAKHGDGSSTPSQPAQPPTLEGHLNRSPDPLTGSGAAPATVEAKHRAKDAGR